MTMLFIDHSNTIMRPERRHKRVLANDLPIRVKFENDVQYEPAYVRDLGEGGMFLRTNRIAPLHSRIALHLAMWGGPELALVGEVVHVVTPEQVALTKPSGMGIRFIDIDPTVQEEIAKYTDLVERSHPQAAPHRTVIIVDDDRGTREMLQIVLELEGFGVKLAANGLRLLSTLHIDKPSAILLDVRMSWIDGFELCRAIKKNPQFSTIPVIFISARSERVDRERGLAMGAVDYFTKPIDTDRLVHRLRDLLDDGLPAGNAS